MRRTADSSAITGARPRSANARTAFTETIGAISLCAGIAISVVLAVFAYRLSPTSRTT